MPDTKFPRLTLQLKYETINFCLPIGCTHSIFWMNHYWHTEVNNKELEEVATIMKHGVWEADLPLAGPCLTKFENKSQELKGLVSKSGGIYWK